MWSFLKLGCKISLSLFEKISGFFHNESVFLVKKYLCKIRPQNWLADAWAEERVLDQMQQSMKLHKVVVKRHPTFHETSVLAGSPKIREVESYKFIVI